MDSFESWLLGHKAEQMQLNTIRPEADQLYKALRLATIAYHDSKKELLAAREALGHSDKPFPFLRLPREVRDSIYQYALQAPSSVQPTHVDEAFNLSWTERSPFKPLAPNLSVANKQIWEESRGVLYAQNCFRFEFAGDLFRFEEQIGPHNRDLVHRLEIWHLNYPFDIGPNGYGLARRTHDEVVREDLLRNTTTCWAITLRKSKLRNICQMKVFGDEHFRYGAYKPYQNHLSMPVDLQKAIETLLSWNHQNKPTPQLILQGFRELEDEKFPAHWKVDLVTDIEWRKGLRPSYDLPIFN